MRTYQIIHRMVIDGSVIDSIFHVKAFSFQSAFLLAVEEASEIDPQPYFLSICECQDSKVTPARMKTRVIKIKNK